MSMGQAAPAELPDNLDIDPEVEAQMQADEAAWARDEKPAEQSDGSPRDEKGRFKGANDGQRAADEGNDEGGEESEGSAETEAADGDKPKPEKPKVSETVKAEQTPKPKPESESKTQWQRDRERRDTSWKALNEEKTKIQREREDIELMRTQVAAQQQAMASAKRDELGYTSATYGQKATEWAAQAQTLMTQAMAAEVRGDFAQQETLEAQARKLNALAGEAKARAARLGGGVEDVWKALAADLPEAMEFNGELNREIRQVLKANPQLLADSMGPLRAGLQVGRKVLVATQQELVKAKAEAAKAEELSKKVAELTQELEGLRRRTSIPGGGAIVSRGSNDSQSWDDLSVDEMERRIAAGQV